MITGRRIAGSLIAATALSLTLIPAAAAEPSAAPSHDHGPKRETGLSIVCQASGKPKGEMQALSKDELRRLVQLRKVNPDDGQLRGCMIISGTAGKRIVRPRENDSMPALNEFPGAVTRQH